MVPALSVDTPLGSSSGCHAAAQRALGSTPTANQKLTKESIWSLGLLVRQPPPPRVPSAELGPECSLPPTPPGQSQVGRQRVACPHRPAFNQSSSIDRLQSGSPRQKYKLHIVSMVSSEAGLARTAPGEPAIPRHTPSGSSKVSSLEADAFQGTGSARSLFFDILVSSPSVSTLPL